MSKRTRYFLFGSALLLGVVLCTGLIAYYNGDLSLGSSAAATDDLAYLPADASAVAYANVHDIMNSEFRQKLKQALPTGEEKDKLQQETGIDIEHDIDSVVAGFAGNAAAGTGPSANGAIVLVRGRLDATHIEALAKEHGGTLEVYKGKRLMLGNLSKAHDAMASSAAAASAMPTTACIGFLESGLVALGDVSAVKRAIDARASRDNITKNADLMKIVSDFDRTSTTWAVGRMDQATHMASLPSQVSDQLAAVQWLSLTAHIDGGVKGVLRAEARDDKSAEDLRAVVNGGLAMARMMAGKDAKMDAMINSLQMTGTGKTVAVAFNVPPEILDMINGAAGLRNLGIKK